MLDISKGQKSCFNGMLAYFCIFWYFLPALLKISATILSNVNNISKTYDDSLISRHKRLFQKAPLSENVVNFNPTFSFFYKGKMLGKGKIKNDFVAIQRFFRKFHDPSTDAKNIFWPMQKFSGPPPHILNVWSLRVLFPVKRL